MSQREGSVRMRHMLDYSCEAVAMIRGKTRQDLDTDRKLNLALVRLLEIVGEAASRTTQDERNRYPSVPWAQISALRNRLVHGYDSIDFDVLWQIVTEDLPPLIAQLQEKP